MQLSQIVSRNWSRYSTGASAAEDEFFPVKICAVIRCTIGYNDFDFFEKVKTSPDLSWMQTEFLLLRHIYKSHFLFFKTALCAFGFKTCKSANVIPKNFSHNNLIWAVFWIRILMIRKFLGLPNPDLFVRGPDLDPDSSIIKQKQ